MKTLYNKEKAWFISKNLLTFPDFGDILLKSIKVDFGKSGRAPLFLVCLKEDGNVQKGKL